MAENAGEIPIAKIPNFQIPIPNEKPNGRKEGAAGFFNESFLLIAPFFWPLGIERLEFPALQGFTSP